MYIEGMVKTRRCLVLCLVAALIQLVVDVPALVASDEGAVRVQNVNWWVEEEEIVIVYDLEGSAEAHYDVSVLFLKEGDTSFHMSPQLATGAVGKGQVPGKEKKIRWAYRQELGQPPRDGKYLFEVSVDVEGGMSWLYWALGGAGAVVGALLLLKKAETPPEKVELPMPPTDRPAAQ
jgi:hypothetical protein